MEFEECAKMAGSCSAGHIHRFECDLTNSEQVSFGNQLYIVFTNYQVVLKLMLEWHVPNIGHDMFTGINNYLYHVSIIH